jgi:hypothetical protein
MKSKLLNQKKFYMLLCSFSFLFCVNLCFAQNPPSGTDLATDGDYRTKASGNWSSNTTWETRTAGVWNEATAPPEATNTVFIQSGHTVTVDASPVSCYSLHINTTGVLAVGAGNTVNVNGKIRCFTGVAVTGTSDGAATPFYLGTDSSATTSTMITPQNTSTIKFVGATRGITFSGEWNAVSTNNGAEFALDAGAIGTLNVGIRFSPLTFSSGTVDAKNALFTTTFVTIKNGAKLISSRSGGSFVISGVTGPPASFAAVTIESGGTLELTGAAPQIQSSAFTNNGTIIYRATGAQALVTASVTATNANDFLNNNNNLVVNSGTTLTIPSGKILTLSGVFTNNGTLTNSGSLILKSSATGTASLLSSSSVANVQQQRYLNSNQRGWRMLGNPLSATTFTALATDSNITLGANFTGEYQTDTNTWTSTDGTAAMDTQKAYKVFITGLTGEAPDYVTGPSNVTVLVKGTAANTVPTAINTIENQFYLVANPYTAPVSVVSIIAASTGLSNSVSYYDPTKTATDVKVKAGGYDAFTVSGAAGSATDIVLPPMGTIFVQASSAGTINIPQSAIFTGTPLQSGTYNHKTAQAKATSNTLKVAVSSEGINYDMIALQFKTVGDASSNIDFGKLPNTFLDAYSLAGSQKMAISELELAAQTIPLGINSTIQKSFSLKVAENTIPAGYEAILIDNLLNTNTVMTAGTTYDFVIDANLASQGDARFAINLKTSGSLSLAEQALDSKIQLWPNPSRGQFKITNTQNQQDGASTIEISNVNGLVVHSQKSNPGTTTTIQTNGWATGVYILKTSINGTQTTQKLIIQ